MSKRSRIELELTKETREELDRKIIENHFSCYREIEDWLKTKGYSISKSNLQRYGKQVEKEIAVSKERLQFAKLLNEQCGDEAGEVSTALTRIVQNQLFDVIQNKEFNNEEMSIAALANAIAKLNYSSLAVQRERAKILLRLQETVEEATEEIKQAGLSDEHAANIRKKMLGVMQ